MGARQSGALTEQEVLQIKNELSTRNNNLKYIFDILVYTGIRESEYKEIANAGNLTKTRGIDVYISKQSKRKIKGSDEFSNKVVKRHIMIPELTFKALCNNDFQLNPIGTSSIKKYVSQIQSIAQSIGISRKISPHDFRATFINLLKHRHYDIGDVKNITQLSLKALESYFARDSDVVEKAFIDLAKDRYDPTSTKNLILNNRRLEDENKLLRLEIESLKEKKC